MTRARAVSVALVLVGVVALVVGVFVLWGVGWALLAAGGASVAAGLFLIPVPEKPAAEERRIHGIVA